MRSAFMRALEEHAMPNTMLVVGDLGFGVVSRFKEQYPRQYINAGVAEQNMTGIAAGLALSGKKVFTYSIANFSTLRPLEQIRNDVAYHNLNVTVVAVGGGMAYGSLGFSHHATEDIAILRALPNMTVLAPGDTIEAYALTKRIIQQDLGPVYLRLGRAGEATLHNQYSIKELKIGKALALNADENADVAILSTGGMLETATRVRELLMRSGMEAAIYSFHTIKPIDQDFIRQVFRGFPFVVSLEEHSSIGGFRSAILESLVGVPNVNLDRYIPFTLPPLFTSRVGDQAYLRDYYGLSPKKIFDKLKKVLQKEPALIIAL